MSSCGQLWQRRVLVNHHARAMMDDEPRSGSDDLGQPVPREALEHELAYLQVRLRQAMYLQGAQAGIVVVVAGVLLFLIDNVTRTWNLSWLTLTGFVTGAALLLTLAHRIPVRTARRLEGEVLAMRTILSADDGDPEPKRQPPAAERS